MNDPRRERSLSFGSEAAAYERGRPSYPPEAVDWLLAPTGDWDARDVLDLGAGTGKLTTRLVERGLRVIAVDPIAEMLDITDGGTTEDMLFSFETVACLGTCFLAPAMMIDDQYFGRLTPQRVESILRSYMPASCSAARGKVDGAQAGQATQP